MTIRGLNRRSFLRVTGGLLFLDSSKRISLGTEPIRTASNMASERGRRFLVSLFDSNLNLLPEFRESKVYWLYHDNYLAAKVLEKAEPEMSKKIMAAIRGFGVTASGKIEILFGEAKAPLPFRHYQLKEVKRIGEKVIKTEVVGDQIHEDWERYSDLLFMASIAEAERDRNKALSHFEAGLKTWDGMGIRDRVNETKGLYATYKLALALVAANRLDQKPDARMTMRERLMSMQRRDGGFVTDYDAQSKPIGEANVETTSLAILALDGDVGENR